MGLTQDESCQRLSSLLLIDGILEFVNGKVLGLDYSLDGFLKALHVIDIQTLFFETLYD